MQIRVKQINSAELQDFVLASMTGTAFAGNVVAYVQSSGWLGTHVLYITGAPQTVLGQKTFALPIDVPYSGLTGQTVARLYIDDKIARDLNSYSGFANTYNVYKTGDQYISGSKIFVNPVFVADPSQSGHAVNKFLLDILSGFFSTGLTNVSVANTVKTTGTQYISGEKTFQFSPIIPTTPTSVSGAVNKQYVDNLQLTGVVYITGDQSITGVKTFLNSPVVPVAVSPSQAVQKAQLDALGTVMGGVTGFAGVLTINGTSGASGNVYLEGAGTVTVNQCGPVFYISGNSANNTQLFSARIPLPSGVTGLTYVFGASGLAGGRPSITDSLEVTGGLGGFFNYYLYNVTNTGFQVAFQSGIPNNNYVYNFQAIPLTTGGSGFFGIQGPVGQRGQTPTPRGIWSAGVLYSYLDFVFLNENKTSYITTTTHASDSFNKPAGTGNAYWQIFSSGIVGPTGDWAYQGGFQTGTIYRRGYSVTYDSSSYAYTGLNEISGVYPDISASGWVPIALKGQIGYLNITSGGYITGNFVNVSYYLSPVGTGLNLAESFIGNNFNITGFKLGCHTTGVAPLLGGILTGNLYTRDDLNTKTILQTFTFNTGVRVYFSGNLAINFTGGNRLGVDIRNTISGIDGFTIGVFGF